MVLRGLAQVRPTDDQNETNDERHYAKQKFHVYSLFSETKLKIARLHDKAEWNPMMRMFQTQLASESVIIGDDE